MIYKVCFVQFTAHFGENMILMNTDLHVENIISIFTNLVNSKCIKTQLDLAILRVQIQRTILGDCLDQLHIGTDSGLDIFLTDLNNRDSQSDICMTQMTYLSAFLLCSAI